MKKVFNEKPKPQGHQNLQSEREREKARDGSKGTTSNEHGVASMIEQKELRKPTKSFVKRDQTFITEKLP